MGLHADAVNFDAVGLNEFDDALGAGGFGAEVLDVVVVVVELGGGVGGRGGFEGDWEVGLADGFVEDAFAVAAVLVEGWGGC